VLSRPQRPFINHSVFPHSFIFTLPALSGPIIPVGNGVTRATRRHKDDKRPPALPPRRGWARLPRSPLAHASLTVNPRSVGRLIPGSMAAPCQRGTSPSNIVIELLLDLQQTATIDARTGTARPAIYVRVTAHICRVFTQFQLSEACYIPKNNANIGVSKCRQIGR